MPRQQGIVVSKGDGMANLRELFGLVQTKLHRLVVAATAGPPATPKVEVFRTSGMQPVYTDDEMFSASQTFVVFSTE
jgi:hypothetical protein